MATKKENAEAKDDAVFEMDQEQFNQFLELATQVSRGAVSVIDVVSGRGGFKGEELSTIGRLRDQCTGLASFAENLSAQG